MAKRNRKYNRKCIKTNANRVFQKSDYRCFYTGLEVKKKGKCNTHIASIEHLLSISMFSRQQVNKLKRQAPELKEMINQFNRTNTVAATRWINGIIGDAPLVVKYALRDHLRSFTIFPGLTLKQERTIYSNLTKKFLKSYCPDGKKWNYPWGWKNQKENSGGQHTNVKLKGFKPKSVVDEYYNDERAAVLKKIFMDLLTDEEKLLLDYS